MPRSRSKSKAASQANSLGRVRSKADLPSKICPVCQRPFVWRKKWQDCWDEVKYCSERCRRHRSSGEAAADASGS